MTKTATGLDRLLGQRAMEKEEKKDATRAARSGFAAVQHMRTCVWHWQRQCRVVATGGNHPTPPQTIPNNPSAR